MNNLLKQLCALAVILSIVTFNTGCKSSSTGPGGGGITVLFTDAFSGTFPAPNWTITAGAPSLDTVNGNPLPSLSCAATGDQAQTVSAFSTAGGVSLSCHLGFPGFVSGQSGRGRFVISDVLVVGANASAVVNLVAANVVYTIGATTSTIATPVDLLYHSYSLVIDGAGNASWFRDGALVMGPQASFPASNLKIELRGTNGGATPTTAKFDNVAATRP